MPSPPDPIFLGCAGWALRKEQQAWFPSGGSHLERYAGRFNAVEINSSFYKPHRATTYARWRASTPEGFRFAVKAPREITHTRRLRDAEPLLDRFLSEIAGLEEKLGPVLVQLPPQLPLKRARAKEFFDALRARFAGAIAFEPRHATWFSEEAEELLRSYRISRVAADPPRAEEDGRPGGDLSAVYHRLHGSPEIYYSAYSAPQLGEIAARLLRDARHAAQVWCIFDNTAEGAATTNALDLSKRLASTKITPTHITPTGTAPTDPDKTDPDKTRLDMKGRGEPSR